MTHPPLRVLLVDEDPALAIRLGALLPDGGPPRPVERVDGAEAARARLDAGAAIDAVVVGPSRGEALAGIARHAPVVALLGSDDEAVQLAALHAGADECLRVAELDAGRLARTLRAAAARRASERGGDRPTTSRLDLLVQIGRRLSSSLDQGETLPAVTRLLVPALAARCRIEVLDETRQAAHTFVASDGLGDEETAAHALTLPLAARGEEFGTLRLERTAAGGPFGDEDRTLAEACASRLGCALDVARIHRTREELLGIISHDLRNPLNVITLAVGMLERTGGSPAALTRQSEKIRQAVQRVNRLIDDLLDVSRLEAGTLPMALQETELGGLLDDALAAVKAQAADKGLDVRVEIAAGLPPLQADRERLLQALATLLGNAVKFTPSQGKVTLAVAPAGDRVRIAVVDGGPSIPKGELPRVFDRYWRGGENRKGIALGLAVTKHIIEAHAGEIDATSEEGVGATFALSLPAGRPRVQAGCGAEAAAGAPRGEGRGEPPASPRAAV